MPSKNGTAIVVGPRSIQDYALNMRVSEMSGPQFATFLRVTGQMQNFEQMSEDPLAMADVIDRVLDFARQRYRRKDGKPITAEEIQWCLDETSFPDLLALFHSSEESAIPPTNAGN